MRSVLHADPRLVSIALTAVNDLLEAESASAGVTPRRGGWRGVVGRSGDHLVIDAAHRTAKLRQRLRIIAPACLVGPVGDHLKTADALRVVAEILDAARPPACDHLTQVLAALLQEPDLTGWREAVIHPGAPWSPPRLMIEMCDGKRRILSAGTEDGEDTMSKDLAHALTEDACHVHAFETGTVLRVRIGSGEPLRIANPGGPEAIRVVRRASEERDAASSADERRNADRPQPTV